MKKQIKKLNLNKRTISNLGTPEMTKIVGGGRTFYCFTDFHCTRGCTHYGNQERPMNPERVR